MDPARRITSVPGQVDPTRVVTSAWLPATQLPGHSRLRWTAQSKVGTTTDAAMLGQDLWTPWCGGLYGFTGRQELDYEALSPQTAAHQYLFTFNSADAAHTAYQAIVDGRTGCATKWKAGQSQHGLNPDLVMAQTASGTSMSAWAWHWTGFGTPVTSDGPQLDHEYLVQRGPVLSILDFDEALTTYSAPPTVGTTDDAATLAAIADHLCSAYAQNCP